MDFFFLGKTCLLLTFLLSLKNDFTLADSRIVGGNEAKIENFPYMLRLEVPRVNSRIVSFCGAGIISNEWAVTAAHCFGNEDKDVNRIRVIAGTADLRNRAATSETRLVNKFIVHELFTGIGSAKPIEGDIAVIKFSPPLKFSNAIKPVKLPKNGEEIKKSWATIAGWGKTSSDGEGTTKLRYVRVPRVSTPKCKEYYTRNNMKFHEGEICYGFHNSTLTKDKCQGDSGGPLVNDDNIALGVVSKGDKCGEHGIPGIYTDVIFFRDWIKRKTGI